jgi:hypothetical protein
MIYESEKMRLEGIRIIKTAGEYKCLVCKDLTSGGKSLCTVLAVHDHEVVRAMLEIFEGQEDRPEEEKTLLDHFSMGEEYIFVFPYRRERPLDSFYMGDAYPLQECEDVCINVLLTCISCNLPYPFLYLILSQRQLNITRDHSIFFSYAVDPQELDISKNERDCTVECARILLGLLESKANQKAISYQILSKKIANKSYQKFTELYRDIRITAAPKEKHGILAKIRAFFRRNMDFFFRILLVVSIVLGLVALVLLLTNTIFGDIPFLRIFFNGFKKIGTESLLQ